MKTVISERSIVFFYHLLVCRTERNPFFMDLKIYDANSALKLYKI